MGRLALAVSGARARLGCGRLVLQLAGSGGWCPRDRIPGPLAKWNPLLFGTNSRRLKLLLMKIGLVVVHVVVVVIRAAVWQLVA